MKAYLCMKPEDPINWFLAKQRDLLYKSGEVLIKVKAIGINPADTIYRNSPTFITHIFGQERPVILGWDIAGEVVEKAENTDGFEVGDAVLALLQNARGYAEFVAVNTELLAHKPDTITFEEAATTYEVVQRLPHTMTDYCGNTMDYLSFMSC